MGGGVCLQVEKPKCNFFQCRRVITKGKNKGYCQGFQDGKTVYRFCCETQCPEYQCSSCIRTGTCIKEPEFCKNFL